MPHYCPCGLETPEGQLYCSPAHRGRYHKHHSPVLKFGYPRDQGKVLEPGIMQYIYYSVSMNDNSRYRWGRKE